MKRGATKRAIALADYSRAYAVALLQPTGSQHPSFRVNRQVFHLADSSRLVTPLSSAEGRRVTALFKLVSQARFELTTFPLGGGCSIQLSYWDE